MDGLTGPENRITSIVLQNAECHSQTGTMHQSLYISHVRWTDNFPPSTTTKVIIYKVMYKVPAYFKNKEPPTISYE